MMVEGKVASLLAHWWFVHPYVARELMTLSTTRVTLIGWHKPEDKHYDAMFKFGDEHRVEGRSSIVLKCQGRG